MGAAECDECGSTPWLAAFEGDFIVRCECKVVVRLGPVDSTTYIPETWEP